MATASQLQQLYVAYFGRAADPSGLDYWVAQGTTTKAFAAHMHGQNEFQSTYGTKSNEAQVNQIYQNLFNRDADAAGLLYWVGQIENGVLSLASIANDLIWAVDNGHGDATDKLTLAAKTSTATSYTAEIRKTTAAILAYQPDSTSPWKSGDDFEAAVSFMNTATSTNTPTAAEVTTNVASLAAEDFGTGTTVNLTSSIDNKTGSADNDNFYALTAGHLATSDIIDGKGGGADKLTAVVEGGTTLRPVLSNVEYLVIDSVDDATAGVDTTTVNLDQSSGVTSVEIQNHKNDETNDDIFAITGITTAVGVTLTDDEGGSHRDNDLTVTYDGVSGTTDTATLTLNSTNAASTFGTITAANVETINYELKGGFDSTVGDASHADATALNITVAASSGGQISASAAKATAVTITAADTFTLVDSDLSKAYTYTIDSTLAKAGTTAASNVVATSITPVESGTKAETLKFIIKGAGTADVGNDVNWDVQSDTNADTVEVDASSNTGGVTADFSAFSTNNARYNKFTGGSGDDTVTIAAGGLDKYDTIAGGAGSDTLTATMETGAAPDDVFYLDTLTGTDLPTISGIEIAKITLQDAGTANSTLDTTTASFADTLSLAGDIAARNQTIDNIKVGQTVKIDGANIDGGDLILTQDGATSSAPADSLTITSNLLEDSGATTSTIHHLKADTVTSVSIDLASTDTTLTEVVLTNADFAKASSVKFTSAEKVTVTDITSLTTGTLDFTGVTGELSVSTDSTNKYTIKGSSTAKSTINMAGTLNNDDTIVGGSGTTDVLTATINGLAVSTSSSTGKLNVSGIETIELDTTGADSTIDLASVTGATSIGVGSAQSVTFENVPAGVGFNLGVNASWDFGGSTSTDALTIKLADTTGTSDTVSVYLKAKDNDAVDTNLVIAGVETVNLIEDTNKVYAAHGETVHKSVSGFTKEDRIGLAGVSATAIALDDVHTVSGKSIGSSGTVAALATHGISIDAYDTNELVLIEVANEADIDSEADMATAFADGGVMDAVDVSGSENSFILIGGADNDATQYLYSITNDNTAAVVESEITLLRTITSNIEGGIAGYTTDNFSFGDDIELDVSGVAATKIVASGGEATDLFDLETQGGANDTLNAATTTLDASALKSALTVKAATNTGTTFSTYGVVGTITGSVVADSVTIGSTSNYIGSSIGTGVNLGTGTDTVTAYLKGSGSIATVDETETINLYIGDLTGTTSSITTGASGHGSDEASVLNLYGGLSGNTTTDAWTMATDHSITYNAADYLGSVALTWGQNILVQTNANDAINIYGGKSSTDSLNIEYNGGTAAVDSGEFTMTGVETLTVASHTTNANTIDLENVTGLNKIIVTDHEETGTQLNVDSAKSGLTIEGGISGGNYEMSQIVDVNLEDASGTSDEITFNLVHVTGSAAGLDATGIETVNIVALANASTETADTISINGTPTTGQSGTINITNGTQANKANDDVTLAAIGTGWSTIDASTLEGALTVNASARASTVMTITGGKDSDTIAMENTGDVLDGGGTTATPGSDTLVISAVGTGGALVVDLGATDQVTLFNGTQSSAVQKGFENVNATAYTQTGSIGADITSGSLNNTITDSLYVDTIKLSGGGTDTVVLNTETVTADSVADGSIDLIYNFKSGALASGGDVLDTSAFSITSGGFYDTGATTITGAIDDTVIGFIAGQGTDIGNKLIGIDSDLTTLSQLAAGILDSSAANKLWVANENAIILYGDFDSTSTDVDIYLVDGSGSSDKEGIRKTATLKSVDATGFIGANFTL